MYSINRKLQTIILTTLASLCLPSLAQDPNHDAETLHGEHDSQVSMKKSAPSIKEVDPILTDENWPKPVMNLKFGTVIIEQLENRFSEGTDTFEWDIQGWYGGDYNRFWFKTEGGFQTEDGSGGESETQLLYSRLIAPFWDVQVGLRVDKVWDSESDPSRVHAVIGLQGLSRYRYEVNPTLFISEDGDIAARIIATKDIMMTQKLILQPSFETEFSSHKNEKFGVGNGLEYVELGLRLRYEIKREFAPYIGVNWLKQYGETAEISRDEGNRDDTFSVVAGLRFWF